MEQHIEKFILNAESKALGTCADGIPNVIPVSSIKIIDGKIWLINYFMDKTIINILKNDNVTLVCWRKMMGYQIKGHVSYKTQGEDFDFAVKWIKEILPERLVKGLIIIEPQEVYDISPTKDTKDKFLSEVQ
jgi:predicted pyridoxine 5'-phosphate oxidase superfamily flavin-nucleotide-binding protein